MTDSPLDNFLKTVVEDCINGGSEPDEGHDYPAWKREPATATVEGMTVDYGEVSGGKRRFTVGCCACGWKHYTDDEENAFEALHVHEAECGSTSQTALDNTYQVRMLIDGDELRVPFVIQAAKDYAIGDNLGNTAKDIADRMVSDKFFPGSEATVTIHRNIIPKDCQDDDDDTLVAKATSYGYYGE